VEVECDRDRFSKSFSNVFLKIKAEIEVLKTESESLIEKGVKAVGQRVRELTLELE
jgi:hypothetical protein